MSVSGSPDGAAPPLWARAVCAGVAGVGSREIVYVPDNPLSHVMRAVGLDLPDARVTIATREEEAFGIAAGLYLGGARPTVMLQSSGLGNSLNALGSLLIPYRIPALIVVSMRGEAGEWNSAQAPLGLAVRPICDALGIEYVSADRPEQAEEAVRTAGERAFSTRLPAACLLSRTISAPRAEPAG
jgi:sulfopyruvate decarboxylase subunit alpha